MTPSIAILLLASGFSSRMKGRDKLLEPVESQSVLEHVTKEALKSGTQVYVALPAQGFEARKKALSNVDVSCLFIENPEQGMGQTISEAIRQIAQSPLDWVLICPADMPEMSQSIFGDVLEACATSDAKIVRACDQNGNRGHPVAFHKDLFPKLCALTGDDGAKSVVKKSTIEPMCVITRGNGATLDLDTVEEWHQWRAARGSGCLAKAKQPN